MSEEINQSGQRRLPEASEAQAPRAVPDAFTSFRDAFYGNNVSALDNQGMVERQNRHTEPNFSHRFQGREISRLGLFTGLWSTAMGCRSIDVSQHGTGDRAVVNVTMQRADNARPYGLPNSDLEIGRQLSFNLSRTGPADNPVLQFKNISGLTCLDNNGERRNVVAMTIRRDDGGGLRYDLQYRNANNQIETQTLQFQNTSPYDGFRDMFERVQVMQAQQARQRR